MPQVDELRGLWRRSLIAWPDGRRDTTTHVSWLQGLQAYIDLRQPAEIRDFSHVKGLTDLSSDDCMWLAKQEGFAGHFKFDGNYFEWVRLIDYQPQSRYSDAGSLTWEGDILVEKGRDVDYKEHWHRDDAIPTLPVAAMSLVEHSTNIHAALLRVGDMFMYARDRKTVPSALQRLKECVAAAPDLEYAQALVDCEISFGSVGINGFIITASTLPYRVGDYLQLALADGKVALMDRATNGLSFMRQWDVAGSEGENEAWRLPVGA